MNNTYPLLNSDKRQCSAITHLCPALAHMAKSARDALCSLLMAPVSSAANTRR